MVALLYNYNWVLRLLYIAPLSQYHAINHWLFATLHNVAVLAKVIIINTRREKLLYKHAIF